LFEIYIFSVTETYILVFQDPNNDPEDELKDVLGQPSCVNEQQYTRKWMNVMEKDGGSLQSKSLFAVQKSSSTVSDKRNNENNNKELSNLLSGNVKSTLSVSTPQTKNKRQTVCILCKKTVSNLARHLRSRQHGIDNPMNIITQNPDYRPSKSKT